jgi:hypothetical protein
MKAPVLGEDRRPLIATVPRGMGMLREGRRRVALLKSKSSGYRGTARMYIWLLIKVRQKQC